LIFSLLFFFFFFFFFYFFYLFFFFFFFIITFFFGTVSISTLSVRFILTESHLPGLNHIYIVGGDGTHRGAQIIADECKKRKLKVVVAGVPENQTT